ncbi:MAG: pyridoxamine 5'-phosphate oxidase family protein, partial [Pseudomonadota bacterium]
MQNYADLMFKDAVAELQRAEGTFEKYQAAYKHRTPEALTDDDIAFINARDSFYMATITSDGWPYVQHRGGTRGFVKVAGPNRLAVPDYHGNRQFISMGNLKTTRRMSLFFMDYLNHARLKVQGEAT